MKETDPQLKEKVLKVKAEKRRVQKLEKDTGKRLDAEY